MAENKILILFAHPKFENSRVNKELIASAMKVKNVKVHDLYETYPDYWINVEKEQELLLQHDIVVFQHPLYWYSVPPLMKQWMDLVLAFNWAYGPQGDKLKGKILLSAVSSGGDQSAYSKEGKHGHTLEEFLLPVKQTAKLCKMKYLPVFASYASHVVSDEKLLDNSGLYAIMLNHLQKTNLETLEVEGMKTMNEWALQQLKISEQ
ncbi:MAG: NAD(P)H-dependent oxidoreductase [Cytophagales bacterium]